MHLAFLYMCEDSGNVTASILPQVHPGQLVGVPPGFWGQRAQTKEPQPVYGK